MNSLLLTFNVPSAIIDVFLVILILATCVGGYKKGFVKSFLSTFGSFISIIIAVVLCSTVANFLETKFTLITKISENISNVLIKIFGEELMLTTLKEATEASLTDSSLSAWLVKIVIDVKGTGNLPLETTVSGVVSPVFGYYITCIISIIGLYVILRIAFVLLGDIIAGLHSFVLIGFADKALGLIFGAIKGVIMAQLLIIVIRVIPLKIFQDLIATFEQSVIASSLDKLNLFSYLLNLITQANLSEIISSILQK